MLFLNTLAKFINTIFIIIFIYVILKETKVSMQV